MFLKIIWAWDFPSSSIGLPLYIFGLICLYLVWYSEGNVFISYKRAGLFLSSKTTAKLESILEENITEEEIIYKLHFFPFSKFFNILLNLRISKKITHFLRYKNSSLRTGVLPLSELRFPWWSQKQELLQSLLNYNRKIESF